MASQAAAPHPRETSDAWVVVLCQLASIGQIWLDTTSTVRILHWLG